MGRVNLQRWWEGILCRGSSTCKNFEMRESMLETTSRLVLLERVSIDRVDREEAQIGGTLESF